MWKIMLLLHALNNTEKTYGGFLQLQEAYLFSAKPFSWKHFVSKLELKMEKQTTLYLLGGLGGKHSSQGPRKGSCMKTQLFTVSLAGPYRNVPFSQDSY